jgi:hypothetical protein
MTATKSAEAIILLDAARQWVLEQVGPLGSVKDALTSLLKRPNNAWEIIPEENSAALREQIEKTLAIWYALSDYRAYLQEPRAWAPAKEDA